MSVPCICRCMDLCNGVAKGQGPRVKNQGAFGEGSRVKSQEPSGFGKGRSKESAGVGANSFEEVTLSRHGGGETPPFHGYAVKGSVGFVAKCHCTLSVASDGKAACEGSAPYWVRHGVDRQASGLREETVRQ